MPHAGELPPSLAELAHLQALELNPAQFDYDTSRLLRVLDGILGQEPDHKPEPPPPPRPRPPPVGPLIARWLSLGSLVLVLLALLGFRSEVEKVVHASRPNLPEDAIWGSVVWLLPALPAMVAALLVVTRKRPGVALGCMVGAALWVITSLVLVERRVEDGAAPEHILVLTFLLGGMIGLIIAEPEMRARARPNGWDRAVPALLLLLVAVVLRAINERIAAAVVDESITVEWFVSGPAEWLAVVIAMLIGLPAALVRWNGSQAQTLRTLAILQILYPIVLRSMTFEGEVSRATDERIELATQYVIVAEVLYLAGGLCIAFAVWAGQRGSQNRSLA
jgi:hypothetical protein